MNPPVIIVLDIETAPQLGYIWGMWKQNLSPKMVKDHPYIMSYAAKDLNQDKVRYVENRKSDDSKIVKSLIKELDRADIVIAHNGDKFDLPTIQARAVVHGFTPPSPYKTIDTLKVAKRHFRFPSNSLEYLTGKHAFNCSNKKLSHSKFPGFELWLECLRNNNEAWKEIKEYNIADVESLEEMYLRMRPWIKNHPNLAVYDQTGDTVCAACNSPNINYRGYAYTNLSRFHKYVCKDCGKWGRDRTNCISKEDLKQLGTNVL